jgi:SAM-dependent methyltransferase
MWRCTECDCAYLDPRPSPDTISLAYENYYTHNEVGGGHSAKRNVKFFTVLAFYRISLNSVILASIERIPFLRDASRRIAHRFRHLPPKGGGRLLDIGCGSGDFLTLAELLGYDAIGIDFDRDAVSVGRNLGRDTHHSHFPGCGLPVMSFDYITFDNVLEHLHDPRPALREALALLKPGGRLWLSQPNLNAIGLQEFGIYWRGLEPPRHLTLWDVPSLTSLLKEVGFVAPTLLPPCPSSPTSFFERSYMQRLGDGWLDQQELRRVWDKQTERSFRASMRSTISDFAQAETVTIVCEAPKSIGHS